MGVPHRYADLLTMLDLLQKHPMTAFVTGAAMYDWYAAQVPVQPDGAAA
jgi:hypothetical protein